jgi:hypothetical protein
MKTPTWLISAGLLLMLLATGCVSNKQFVRIPDVNNRIDDPAKGRIYLVRPSNMGTAVSMEVWDGNVHVGNTGADSYLCWEREPGEAIVSGREENVSTVAIWVKPNQSYYIFQHLRMGWLQARNELEVVPEEQGKKIMKGCRAPKPSKCEDHPECVNQPAK